AVSPASSVSDHSFQYRMVSSNARSANSPAGGSTPIAPSASASVTNARVPASTSTVARAVSPSMENGEAHWKKTARPPCAAARRDREVARRRVEDAPEDGVGVEPRQAQPVDRAVIRNQRRGPALADQAVALDRQVRGPGGRARGDALRLHPLKIAFLP